MRIDLLLVLEQVRNERGAASEMRQIPWPVSSPPDPLLLQSSPETAARSNRDVRHPEERCDESARVPVDDAPSGVRDGSAFPGAVVVPKSGDS